MDVVSAKPQRTAVAGGRRSSPPAPAVLAVTCVATLIALMNYTAPMTVLGVTANSLHTGPAGQTWILNGISVGLAALLLTAGSLADEYGRKRAFVIGALLLAVASIGGAIAPNTLLFVLSRGVQGGASAALIAAGLGLAARAFDTPAARVRATAVWSSMLGAGIALGPIVSALLTGAAGWRSFYLAVAVASAALAVSGLAVLGESRADLRRRIDLLGMLTLAGSIVCLLAALTLGRTGWLRPTVLSLLVLAGLLLAGFLLRQARGRHPMLDLNLFRSTGFVAATGGALLTGVAVIGLMSYLPTILQRDFGLSPLATAGLLAVWSGSSFLVALQVRRLPSRFHARHQLVLGLLLAAAGDLAMLGALGSWPWLVPGLLIGGVGSGVLNAALARLSVETVPSDRTAMGSGANNTARYVGSSLGVALIVALAAGSPHGAGLALTVSTVISVLGGAVILALRGDTQGSRRRPTNPRSSR